MLGYLGEILMEGSQGGCAPTHQGVYIFPTEQRGAQTSHNIVGATPYSIWKVGKYFHELHHQPAYGSG